MGVQPGAAFADETGWRTWDCAAALSSFLAEAARVIATDRASDDDLLSKMEQRVEEAQLVDRIHVRGLDWGDISIVSEVLRVCCNEKEARLDLVLACECLHWPGCNLFEDDPLPLLAGTLSELLRPGARALVAYRERATAREEGFFALCRDSHGLVELAPRRCLDAWAPKGEAAGDEADGSDAAGFWLAELGRPLPKGKV